MPTSLTQKTPAESMLFRWLLWRLNNGRDAQILVVARGGARGTGKTTLAVAIAKWIHSLFRCPECMEKNEHGDTVGGFYPREFDECPWCGHDTALRRDPWSADNAFIDIRQYLNTYRHQSSPGDALILDEAEFSADSRRSMSNENLHLSQAWSILRYKSVVSIATMPSTLHIDRRLEELADVKINVQKRGLALLDWYWLNDSEKEVWDIPLRDERGAREYLFWDSLSDDEYLKVAQMKSNHVSTDGSNELLTPEEADERAEELKKQEIKPLRVRSTEALLERTDLSQEAVGEIVDRSQQWVSKVARGSM